MTSETKTNKHTQTQRPNKPNPFFLEMKETPFLIIKSQVLISQIRFGLNNLKPYYRGLDVTNDHHTCGIWLTQLPTHEKHTLDLSSHISALQKHAYSNM